MESVVWQVLSHCSDITKCCVHPASIPFSVFPTANFATIKYYLSRFLHATHILHTKYLHLSLNGWDNTQHNPDVTLFIWDKSNSHDEIKPGRAGAGKEIVALVGNSDTLLCLAVFIGVIFTRLLTWCRKRPALV
ncbi:uncharacterized protein BJ212DRAFT_730569 [Suillus subaureus]|uniref:Uncharacterized protein n=1 Tax=Suillus subaureus TaxID=48587 RepID=A0A9P7E0B6_9AGAM|nr:uncharacterized protein BJ212DRAFT_730569 [Suillus subaureus]KAG1807852.1 hypothetical protein BJ212DRAFT_730569 [Suillus subaureus]